MGFDYVLAHREHQYLATETNWTTFQVPWESIAATCLGASIARRTVESRPLGTSWISSRSSSRARSAGGLLWSVLLHRRGGQKAIRLRHLLAAVQRSVRSAGLVPVAADQSMFAKAKRIFSRRCPGSGRGRTARPSIRKSGDCWIMFYDRDLLEQRQTASFDKRQLDQLSDELREFRGPKYEVLFRHWRQQGGSSQRNGPRRTTVGLVHNLTADY